MTDFIGKEDKQAEPTFTSIVQRPFFDALDKRGLVLFRRPRQAVVMFK
jgi:hypothetical protein